MADIFITGHRNPDMDSVCSAYAYAYLKNKLNPTDRYIPVRCGNLNDATKAQFERIGAQPPQYMKDVRCRLSTVVRRGEPCLDIHDPVYNLIPLFAKMPSAVSVMENGAFKGLISVDEVNRFFLHENSGGRPLYHIVIDNIPKVLHGRFLKRGKAAEFEGPLVVGAMRYAVFSRYLDALVGKQMLLVVGDREEHIKKAIERQVACIILTGVGEKLTADVNFSGYDGSVFVSDEDTSETIRLLRLSVPISQLMDENPPSLDGDMLFDEAKNSLAASKYRGMPVFQNGKWIGFVTRRCFLERPRTKVILVDHNEKEQSIPGVEEAELEEIIDHHRMGSLKTPNPIYILCDPLGSTCTIVTTLFQRLGVEITPLVAKVLLSGIISDTVVLKSPTTTDVDRTAVKVLCSIGGIESLDRFAADMFSTGATLEGKDPLKLVQTDFKEYKEDGKCFGIGQCEVTTLSDVDEYKDALFGALHEIRHQHMMDFVLLMITDVIHENSVLLADGLSTYEPKLAYTRESAHKFFLPGVLSRKKQLLPEILRVLEEG